MIKPNMNITSGVYSYIARPYIYVAEYINITKEMIMKILKLTKKQYEVLRSCLIQASDCQYENLDGLAHDVDGKVIDKKSAKEFRAYVRVLKKLEIKLNCSLLNG